MLLLAVALAVAAADVVAVAVVAIVGFPKQFSFNSSQFNVNILCRFACAASTLQIILLVFYLTNSSSKIQIFPLRIS